MSKNEEIKNILINLGYQLDDRGDYWQTNALYRNGDNRTALQIYKNTGVWKDYVEETSFLPFKALIEKSCKELGKSAEDILKSLGEESSQQPEENQQRLKIEEIYKEEELSKLLPHFKFYKNKGIDEDVLKSLKCGLSTQGQMYQRFVFPIYNEYSQIVGFAGRDMLDKENRPKWKQIGKKTTWSYPIHVPTFKPNKNWNNNDIILVESIGDFLSIYQNTNLNCLVTFGLDVSKSLINTLISICPDNIIISTNNDFNNTENRGLHAAIKNYLKLLKFFDWHKLRICLPVANDFGDMNKEDFECWQTKLEKIKDKDQRKDIITMAETMLRTRKISKSLISNKKYIS